MTTITKEVIHLGQIEPIRFSDLTETPTTRDGYGITDVFTMDQSDARYVRYDVEQSLTDEQKQQARDNIGIDYPNPIHVHYIGDGSTDRFEFGVGQTVNFISGDNTTVTFNPANKSIAINAPAPGTPYTHPTQSPISSSLSGKQVYSGISVNSLGHFTGYNTRTDLPYVDFTSDEVITGLKTIRRAGPNDGSAIQEVFSFSIDPSGDLLYRMMIQNSQNEQAPAGEVNWFFTMRENYRSSGVDFDRIGFHRGGTVVLGGRFPSQAMSTDISTFTFNDLTDQPYPISTFVKRSMMVENRIYSGKEDLDSTLFLGFSDRIYSSGRIYSLMGFRTPDPKDYSVVDGSSWLLGKAFDSVDDTVTKYVEINIDGVVYELLARQKSGDAPGPPVDPEVVSTDIDWAFTNADLVTGSFKLEYVQAGVSTTLLTSTLPSSGSIVADEGTYVRITVINDHPMSPDPGPAILLQVETVTPSSSIIYYKNSPPVSEEIYDLYVVPGTTYEITAFISEDDEV